MFAYQAPGTQQVEADRADPRVLRTRGDVIDTATALYRAEGWTAMTHAEVARGAGYSKAVTDGRRGARPGRLSGPASDEAVIEDLVDRVLAPSGHDDVPS